MDVSDRTMDTEKERDNFGGEASEESDRAGVKHPRHGGIYVYNITCVLPTPIIILKVGGIHLLDVYVNACV